MIIQAGSHMEDEAEVTQSVTPNPPEPSAKVGVTRRPPPNCLKEESPRARDERASHEREGCRGPDLRKPPPPPLCHLGRRYPSPCEVTLLLPVRGQDQTENGRVEVILVFEPTLSGPC